METRRNENDHILTCQFAVIKGRAHSRNSHILRGKQRFLQVNLQFLSVIQGL
mgnify:CR=1 FL=1